MLQEASNGALWNVPFAKLRAGFRGRFAAAEDEDTGFWVSRQGA